MATRDRLSGAFRHFTDRRFALIAWWKFVSHDFRER